MREQINYSRLAEAPMEPRLQVERRQNSDTLSRESSKRLSMPAEEIITRRSNNEYAVFADDLPS